MQYLSPRLNSHQALAIGKWARLDSPSSTMPLSHHHGRQLAHLHLGDDMTAWVCLGPPSLSICLRLQSVLPSILRLDSKA